MSESDEIIREKIEKSIELICLLYNNNLIIDAYIVGSIAKGTAVKKSDIDMIIINPEFKESYDQLMPNIDDEKIMDIINILEKYGARSKKLEIPEKRIFGFWFQLYKDELFHIMPQRYFTDSLHHTQITRDLCQ